MPETLIFTTSNAALGDALEGDELLIERSSFPGTIAFLLITEKRGGSASLFLSLDEALALNEQLAALIQDAVAKAS